MANKRLVDVDAFLADHCGECRYTSNGACSKDDPICGTIWDLVEYPTVDAVEVVHGRWVNQHWRNVCSECRYIVGQHSQTKYCPNCGAKMDGDTIG